MQPIKESLFKKHHLNLFIKRDDLIHKYISGNKWRKLKYNFEDCINKNKKRIITFGGAFSNHVVALSYAAKLYNIKALAFIRGEKEYAKNSSLSFAIKNGMELIFISRSEYRLKERSLIFKKICLTTDYYVQEGGANPLGERGVSEIVNEIKINYDYLVSAVGTGTTIFGISKNNNKQTVGILTLKNEAFIKNSIMNKKHKGIKIFSSYHFGGYAKYTEELIDFILSFKEKHNIILDPIYTGKALFGIYDLTKRGFFNKGTTIVFLHTGGIQGILGFNEMNKTRLRLLDNV
mgnify:CR=1 FL=1